jgi:Lon-like ATP-dependent protease
MYDKKKEDPEKNESNEKDDETSDKSSDQKKDEEVDHEKVRPESVVENDVALEPYSSFGRKATGSIQKPSIPEKYPQVLLLPISRRPLFPGFYKSVVIKDPSVIGAIKELLNRGQPYVGAFMLKDDDQDTDIVSDINQVHRVGVFSQIANVYLSSTPSEEQTLTALLYPHRRIQLNEVLPPQGT